MRLRGFLRNWRNSPGISLSIISEVSMNISSNVRHLRFATDWILDHKTLLHGFHLYSGQYWYWPYVGNFQYSQLYDWVVFLRKFLFPCWVRMHLKDQPPHSPILKHTEYSGCLKRLPINLKTWEVSDFKKDSCPFKNRDRRRWYHIINPGALHIEIVPNQRNWCWLAVHTGEWLFLTSNIIEWLKFSLGFDSVPVINIFLLNVT